MHLEEINFYPFVPRYSQNQVSTHLALSRLDRALYALDIAVESFRDEQDEISIQLKSDAQTEKTVSDAQLDAFISRLQSLSQRYFRAQHRVSNAGRDVAFSLPPENRALVLPLAFSALDCQRMAEGAVGSPTAGFALRRPNYVMGANRTSFKAFKRYLTRTLALCGKIKLAKCACSERPLKTRGQPQGDAQLIDRLRKALADGKDIQSQSQLASLVGLSAGQLSRRIRSSDFLLSALRALGLPHLASPRAGWRTGSKRKGRSMLA